MPDLVQTGQAVPIRAFIYLEGICSGRCLSLVMCVFCTHHWQTKLFLALVKHLCYNSCKQVIYLVNSIFYFQNPCLDIHKNIR